MDTVEFRPEVRDGNIEIPTQYRERFTDQVTVILVADASPRNETPTLIDELLAKPLELPAFHRLTRDETHAR